MHLLNVLTWAVICIKKKEIDDSYCMRGTLEAIFRYYCRYRHRHEAHFEYSECCLPTQSNRWLSTQVIRQEEEEEEKKGKNACSSSIYSHTHTHISHPNFIESLRFAIILFIFFSLFHKIYVSIRLNIGARTITVPAQLKKLFVRLYRSYVFP